MNRSMSQLLKVSVVAALGWGLVVAPGLAATDSVIGTIYSASAGRFDVSGPWVAYSSSQQMYDYRDWAYSVLSGDTFDVSQYPESSLYGGYRQVIRLSDNLLVSGGSVRDFLIDPQSPIYYAGLNGSATDIDRGVLALSSYRTRLYSATRGQLAYLTACGLAGGEDSVPEGPAIPTFVDLPTDHWAYKYVEYTVAQGMTLGFSDSTFRPGEPANVAELAAWCSRAAAGGEVNVPAGPITPSFFDVPADHWAYKYVELLRTLVHDPWFLGIVGEFRPRQSASSDTESWLEQCIGAPVNICDVSDYYSGYQTVAVQLATTHEEIIAESEPGATSAALDRGRIVWQSRRDGDWEICLYDAGTDEEFGTADDIGEVRITDSADDEMLPAVSDRLIAWQDNRSGTWHIYLYDLGPDGLFGTADDDGESQVTHSGGNHLHPSISGGVIVWEDNRTGTWEVYMYDLGPDRQFGTGDDGGETQITNSDGRFHYPRIDGQRIVYVDGTDLHLYDMHDYVLAPDFAADELWGECSLEVAFTDQSVNAEDIGMWEWDFGDGETSAEQSPTHLYDQPGIYTVSLAISNAYDMVTETKPAYVVVSFSDVPPDHWALEDILACAKAGIVQGYDGCFYQPGWAVARDQMAVYIARALAGGDENVPEFADTPTFPDVPEGYWALDHVEYAVDQNVVAGYDDGLYHPEDEVDRGQMAVYVARAKGWVAIDDDMTTAPEVFPDVPAGFWAGTAIETCVENDVVRGYDDGYYRPEATVTRDQMAVYVARAFGLGG